MECYGDLRKVQADGRCGELFRGPVIPFGSTIKYHPVSAKDSTKLGRQFYLESSWDMHDMKGGFGRLVQLEKLDAPEVHARRLNAKETIMPKEGENFIFPIAGGTVKIVWRRSGTPKIHLKRRVQWRPSRKFGQVSTNRRNG